MGHKSTTILLFPDEQFWISMFHHTKMVIRRPILHLYGGMDSTKFLLRKYTYSSLQIRSCTPTRHHERNFLPVSARQPTGRNAKAHTSSVLFYLEPPIASSISFVWLDSLLGRLGLEEDSLGREGNHSVIFREMYLEWVGYGEIWLCAWIRTAENLLFLKLWLCECDSHISNSWLWDIEPLFFKP